MEYPDGFNTPAFPAGPRLAVSRAMAIATMVVFLLIVFACGFLLWAQHSVRVHPFLVSINNITGQWSVVGHRHDDMASVSTTRTLQESVIGKFVENWFLLTDNDENNTARWRSCDRATQCNPENRTGIDDSNDCAIYCLSGEDIYSRFLDTVVPDYQTRVINGEQWLADMPSLQITPIGTTTVAGGAWQVRVNIYTNVVIEPIKILAYVQVARNTDLYPQTMGYYIADFNAYRMN